MNQGTRATPFEQRLAIWEQAQTGQTDGQIAKGLGLGVSVVRKWRRRSRQGRPGLVSQMGRPAQGPLSHSAPSIREAVKQMRAEHAGWGPLTLRAELARPSRALGRWLPGRTQIAQFLRAERLSRRYAQRLPLDQPVAAAEVPHAEWQMDAQGVQWVSGVGRVVVINLGDPFTRLLTESLAYRHSAKPKTADYQLALRRAFMRFGCPLSLSLDHDSVFHDPTSASPYPSRLHLWLLALGLTVRFIDIGRPTQHGFIEHEHQVMTHQVLDDLAFAGPDGLQRALDERSHFLNTVYPNRVLGGRAPLQVFRSAVYSGRAYSPEREAELLDGQRVYAYLAKHTWFRRASLRGQVELGTYRYNLGLTWGKQTVQITFDPQTLEVICCSEDGHRTQRLPAQGLTPTDWMGELKLETLPTYQLGFPWSEQACRMAVLFEDWAGTT